MTKPDHELRFEFGKNWLSFLDAGVSQENLDASRRDLLGFFGLEKLDFLEFLDVGSGSGIHSLAAFDSGARKVRSFDYDPDSVRATAKMHELRGHPDSWVVERGSILDAEYVKALGQYDLVYSWGVLHHTGDVWTALGNAARLVKDEGLLYISLYDSDWCPEDPESWLRIKRDYVQGGALRRLKYELWYGWTYLLDGNVRNLPRAVRHARTYKKNRGMSLFHDTRDWLGGWPMEYTRIFDIVPFMQARGLRLQRVKTGEATVEYLFKKGGTDLLQTALPVSWNVRSVRTESDLLAIEKTKPLYIYGAGRGGELVMDVLGRLGYRVSGFITTSAAGSFRDLPVIPLRCLAETEAEIVIASQHYADIAIGLANGGFFRFYCANALLMRVLSGRG